MQDYRYHTSVSNPHRYAMMRRTMIGDFRLSSPSSTKRRSLALAVKVPIPPPLPELMGAPPLPDKLKIGPSLPSVAAAVTSTAATTPKTSTASRYDRSSPLLSSTSTNSIVHKPAFLPLKNTPVSSTALLLASTQSSSYSSKNKPSDTTNSADTTQNDQCNNHRAPSIERCVEMEPPKDTLVRLSEYDEERSPTNSCCCGAIHIRHGAIVIALLSLFSSTVNGILICLGISRTALNFFVEVGMLVADLVAIVALFYGVIYRRPAFLKPYLLVNILWNLVLLLLFFLCIIQLFKDEEMSRNIMWNFLEVSSYRPRRAQLKTVATLATITMISGLLVTIVINFWFLYVVFLCFQWMNAYVVKINDSTRPTPDDDPFTVKAITNNTDISASTQNHTETKSKDNDRMFDLNSTSNGIIL